MAIESGKAHLEKFGLLDRVMEFDVSSATVEAAAIAVGSSEAEIAKTLSFLVGEKPILIVTAGDAKIDNKKYKGEFHAKAKMIPFENVEEMIGHAVGGVCPFGVNENVNIYLGFRNKELVVLEKEFKQNTEFQTFTYQIIYTLP